MKTARILIACVSTFVSISPGLAAIRVRAVSPSRATCGLHCMMVFHMPVGMRLWLEKVDVVHFPTLDGAIELQQEVDGRM